MTNCCKDCKRRYVGCHADCKKYKQERIRLKEEKKKRKIFNEKVARSTGHYDNPYFKRLDKQELMKAKEYRRR